MKEALKFFDSSCSDSQAFIAECRNHLREIGIVVSDKIFKQRSKRNGRKIRSELLGNIDVNSIQTIGQLILFEITGCRFKWFIGPSLREEWKEIFPPCNDPEVSELITKFCSDVPLLSVVELLASRSDESSP